MADQLPHEPVERAMCRLRRHPIMQVMNLLLAILLGTGAVVGALGMLLLIAGGVATALLDEP